MSRAKQTEVDGKQLSELIEGLGGKDKVAQLMETTLNTVYKWIQHEKLPEVKWLKLQDLGNHVPLLTQATDKELMTEVSKRGLVRWNE